MSFADLERGEGPRRTASPLRLGNNTTSGSGNSNDRWNRGGPSGSNLGDVSSHAYEAQIQTISQQVFRISSNVSSIQRLVGFLGTAKDNQDVRKKLHDITEETTGQVKETSREIKSLSSSAGKKLKHQKLSKDFQKVLVDFQKVQRVSAEKQREFVERAKSNNIRNDLDDGDHDDQPLIDDSQRRMQLMVVDNELEYNESMIAQREDEILEIEHGITELNEIFRDLGTMVHEQGGMLDSIESNVTSISMSTRSAAEELTTAAVYQKKARNKMCCLMLIVSAVAAVVALALIGSL